MLQGLSRRSLSAEPGQGASAGTLTRSCSKFSWKGGPQTTQWWQFINKNVCECGKEAERYGQDWEGMLWKTAPFFSLFKHKPREITLHKLSKALLDQELWFQFVHVSYCHPAQAIAVSRWNPSHGTESQTQGLAYSRQVLNHWPMASAPYRMFATAS